jgi:hypothetical protein
MEEIPAKTRSRALSDISKPEGKAAKKGEVDQA